MPRSPHAAPRRRGRAGVGFLLSGLLTLLAAGCGVADAAPGPARIVVGGVWLLVFTLAAVGAGGIAMPLLGGGRRPALVDLPLRAALGAATLALASGLLGASGLLARAPLAIILLGCAAAGSRRAFTQGRRFLRAAGKPPLAPLVVLLASGVLTFLVATVPAPFYDQFHYHLAFPEHWLREGGIRVFERQIYSFFPANMGLLYLYALAGPGVQAAQLVHWWCGALAAISAGALARLAGGRRDAFWRAACLVAGTPSILLLSGWAGTDLGIAAFGAAAWLALLGARRRGTHGRALSAGLLGGVAVGCKYIAVATVALPLAAGAALAAAVREPTLRSRARQALVLLLVLAAGGLAAYAPWGVRNARLTGDPMHPFLAARIASFVPSESLAHAERSAAGIASPVAEDSRLASALTLRAFSPKGDAGEIGPVWLLVIPAWIVATCSIRRRAAAPLLLAGVVIGIALWSQFHQLGRYLVPVLVVAAAGGGATWSAAHHRLGRTASWAVSALVLTMIAWGAASGTDAIASERLAIAFGRGDEDALMKRYVSYWPMIPVVNTKLPEDARILLVAESRSLHLERAVLVEDPFHAPLLVELADREGTAPSIAAELSRLGVTHVLFNEHEADRIRRMTGRSAYFEPRGQASADALRSFFSSCLDGVARRGPAVLYRLDTACPARQSAPDRASP